MASGDKIESSSMTKKWRTDAGHGYGYNSLSSTRTKLLEEIFAKRMKEFQRSQAEKTAKIKYLTQERQRILDAHKQLKERHNKLHRIPSPVGKATERMWGDKYLLYTPLHFDPQTQVYVPTFQDGYYTYFPHTKWKKQRWFKGDMLFVPTPLYQSLW